jgi:hypothetical protein
MSLPPGFFSYFTFLWVSVVLDRLCKSVVRFLSVRASLKLSIGLGRSRPQARRTLGGTRGGRFKWN